MSFFATLHAPAAPDVTWFRDAKFGIFVHWGLYSELGNEWKGQSYYGSAEWIMNRAKIPAAEYARIADRFIPTNFNAAEWARLVKESGARYIVVTAKHHEGFAMFNSKTSPFNIVDATPFHHDPMKDLAVACRKEGVKFGFYYSQFLDWHEPNGGGNTWDFPQATKDYKSYYAQKSIPQIKELLSNYGPLGLIWFDMPGGLNRDETIKFMDEVRQLQPDCLISSRVGNGLGDFRDFGDSELPPHVINGAWEALFTHNDSWGFAKNDRDFKSSRDILHLLAATASRGGNLILNVGPDGSGRIPEISQQCLREVGKWLAANGESIYGTTHSPIPGQPWGVATMKTNRLFLHIFDRPKNGIVFVPGFSAQAKGASLLADGESCKTKQQGEDLEIFLPAEIPDDAKDTVVAVDFTGVLQDAWGGTPEIISRQFSSFALDAAKGKPGGQAIVDSKTSSQYFGNWKHDTVARNMSSPTDTLGFSLRFLEPGTYRLMLEYACSAASKGQEGIVDVGEDSLGFQSLLTGEYNNHEPLLFIRQNIGVFTVKQPGMLPVSVHPRGNGHELFWLRRVLIEPLD